MLEAAFELSPTPIAIMDREFNLVRVNRAYADACDAPGAVLVGCNHFAVFPSGAQTLFGQVLQTRQPISVKADPIMYPDHPERGVTYWDWSLVPMLDEQGEVELLFHTLRDVSPRVRANAELTRYREELEAVVAERTDALAEANRELRHTVAELLQTQEALRSTGGRLAAIIQSSPLPIIALDREARVELWNPAAEAMFGWTAGQVQGEPLPIVPPELRDAFAEFYRNQLAGMTHHGLELEPIAKDGSVREVSLTTVPLQSAGGQITGIMGILVDIAAQKDHARAQEEHLRWLNDLIDCSEQIIAETTVEGVLQRTMDAARRLTRAQMAVAGHGYVDGKFRSGWVSHAEGVPPCPDGSTFTFARGGVYEALLRGQSTLRLSDEEMRQHPQWRGLPPGHAPLRGLLGAAIDDMAGQPRGVVMVSCRDEGDFTVADEAALKQLVAIASLALRHIDARQEAEQAAREMQAVFSAMADPVTVYDASGTIVRANPAALAAFGAEMVGLTMAELSERLKSREASGQGVSLDRVPSVQALRGQEARGGPYRLRKVSGEESWGLVSSASIRTGDNVAGAVAIWHDITEQLRLQAELQAHRDQLEDVIRQRTADLEATATQLQAEVMGHRQAREELLRHQQRLRDLSSEQTLAVERERRCVAAGIHDSVGQLLASIRMRLGQAQLMAADEGQRAELAEISDLTRQVIDYTRSLTFELSPPVLHELGLEAGLDWLAEDHTKRGLKTRFVDDKQYKPVAEDTALLLYHTVRELLSNVSNHAQANEAVVEIARHADRLCIAVSDDGVGFDPAEAAGTNSYGLFSIRERLSNLGGSAEVESRPAAGTRVTLWVPLPES